MMKFLLALVTALLAIDHCVAQYEGELIAGPKGANLCFFLFQNGGSVSYKPKDDGPITKSDFVAKDVKVGDVTCTNNAKNYFAQKVTITGIKDANSIEFVFDKTDNFANWGVKSIETTINGEKYTGVNLLSTPGGFCRSCMQESLSLATAKNDKGQVKRATITFNRFHLQPFTRGEITDQEKFKFESSSDCATWLTLPLISAIIVILLTLTILYSGVRALMSISTPDRFENPKGKGLIITNFDE